MDRWQSLNRRIIRCAACPRLREHCRVVGQKKRAAFANQHYWARPVENFGDPQARLLIVGLAPAAHGANRTGQMFAGDRSGDFLFSAMYRAGLCNQPESTGKGDGLALIDTVVTGAGHCAPPGNRPTAEELDACSGYLDQTFELLPALKVVISLGGIAHRAVLGLYRRRGLVDRINPYPFGHGAWHTFDNAPDLVCCYHPSQQNTFTGRLTPDMLFSVLDKAREHAAGIA